MVAVQTAATPCAVRLDFAAAGGVDRILLALAGELPHAGNAAAPSLWPRTTRDLYGYKKVNPIDTDVQRLALRSLRRSLPRCHSARGSAS